MKRFLLVSLFLFPGIFFAKIALSANYDATGTWKISESGAWADSGNVGEACTTQSLDADTTIVTQSGDTFTMTIMEDTAQGSVSGSVYTVSYSFPERGGTATMSFSITLSSETYGTGTLTWTWELGVFHCNGGSDLSITKKDSSDSSPPDSPVKLIFIHHSTGGNWLADPVSGEPYGGLGTALMNNNYYVSATNYGWGTESIGSRTDIPNWPEWFAGPNSSTIMTELCAETGQNFNEHGSWSRLADDPGGENKIIMFKSCFPNSDLFGNPDDPPASEPNDWEYSVSNAKAVYNKILTYFATRQDKLFVVITAPPQTENEYGDDYQTPAHRAANARAFNNWLLSDWLNGYSQNNVGVFDYFNVLTDPGNHHRMSGSQVEHIITNEYNFAAYPTNEWDSHPNAEGHQKATTEFPPLLNYYYNKWKESGTHPGRAIINGNILNQGEPLCAMVLANGEYTFTCEQGELGKYQLDIPLNDDGELTLFGFADGFEPFSQTMKPEQAKDFDISMIFASGDTPKTDLSHETEATANPDWFRISGKVSSEDGTPLCGMVLANGEHMFSCKEGELGEYELEVPVNESREITLLGFADGFQPYRLTFEP